MDAWERMFRDEEERDLFFIQEELREMEQSVIRQFQDEAVQAYERLPQPEAAVNAQVVMLAEIVQQLDRLNQQLEVFSKRLEES